MNNTFWHSIARYNEATWLWQAIIVFVGVVVTLWFAIRPSKRTTLVVKLYTTVLYLASGGLLLYLLLGESLQ